MFRDDDVIAIEDVAPQAPSHVLVLPVRHFANVGSIVDANDDALLSKLIAVASRIGRERDREGFRLVVNTGPHGGQTVDHVHVHVLSGRPMTWPPG